jgi:endo-1,4-beta-xylanase
MRLVLLAIAVCATTVPCWSAEPPFEPLWKGATAASALQQEHVRITELAEHVVSHVQVPSLAHYAPAPERASGIAVIVIPGGAHRELWLDHEGYRVAEWLQVHGAAAFILKYRLSQEPGSKFSLEDELADVNSAILFVQAHAAEWRLSRIGVLGFSAGGELALRAGLGGAVKPDFMALIYPGVIKDMIIASRPPPAFVLVGENDSETLVQGASQLFAAAKAKGASVELHILAHAGHGFGIRATNPPTVALWPTLLSDWLEGLGQPGR